MGGDPIPLSALNQYLYCPRRCALIHLEGTFQENVYTVEGTLAHEVVDEYRHERRFDAKMVTALPVFSVHRGVAGRCDVVEFQEEGERSARRIVGAYPIEFKRGKAKEWTARNDDVQLCAQALCLEEMFSIEIEVGAIFHVSSRKRRELVMDCVLRELTERAIDAVRELFARGSTPPGFHDRRCADCSMHSLCMPELTASNRAAQIERGVVTMWEGASHGGTTEHALCNDAGGVPVKGSRNSEG